MTNLTFGIKCNAVNIQLGGKGNPNLAMMEEFAKAFERRYRDVKKRNHCLSIEWKYQPENPENSCNNTSVRVNAPFGEDAFFIGLRTWGKLDNDVKNVIKIAFGFGAGSQMEYEDNLQHFFGKYDKELVDEAIILSLFSWLLEIQKECGSQEDFRLLFFL
ncbi:hypothetical protein [Wielerella bovis]|uniref:hypothetical protein n=1 Tax=Wielerella bovis TaxID=2917790 RepID=UPI0020190A77|nr:hypothetical protein [Wielerella bovis]ULJ65922.1 hypothetical protein MIS31_06470 [Wielerella bovis]